METESGVHELIDGLRSADSGAMRLFVTRYRPALERLAAKNIEPSMRRRFGAESVAQSACRTFLRRVQRGGFEVVDGDRLWSLLCAIALAKVHDKARFHLRHKRSPAREQHGDPADVAGAVAADEPTPDESVALADALEHALADCGDEERRLVELRLEGRQVSEIADELECSRRTVSRLLQRIEKRFLDTLGG